MAEEPRDRIKDAFKEFWCVKDLRVHIEKGEIVCIPAQTVQRPERAGVITQHTIREDIGR